MLCWAGGQSRALSLVLAQVEYSNPPSSIATSISKAGEDLTHSEENLRKSIFQTFRSWGCRAGSALAAHDFL